MSDSKNLDAHLFVCTNSKEKGASCAPKGSNELRDQLKKLCQDEARGWHGRVRVNASGCLGRCAEGITAVLYPEGRWFTRLTSDSVAPLEEALASTLAQKKP
jgi:(2Fe-2S) ferredoxin